MKRAFDLLFSGIALIVFAIPVGIIVGLLVFREKHAVIFKQQRIGMKKRVFLIWKFQTLVNEIPTKTGTFLRKTGLDELPQFVNVFNGDMSIVGPRALTEFDIDRLRWNDDFHSARWKLKPGITGLAQLYGGQHRKTSWFFDKIYIQRQNLLLDFAIISCSFLMNIFGKTRIRRLIFQRKKLK